MKNKKILDYNKSTGCLSVCSLKSFSNSWTDMFLLYSEVLIGPKRFITILREYLHPSKKKIFQVEGRLEEKKLGGKRMREVYKVYLEAIWQADRIDMRIPLEVHQSVQFYQGYIIVQVSRSKLGHVTYIYNSKNSWIFSTL